MLLEGYVPASQRGPDEDRDRFEKGIVWLIVCSSIICHILTIHGVPKREVSIRGVRFMLCDHSTT